MKQNKIIKKRRAILSYDGNRLIKIGKKNYIHLYMNTNGI